MKVEKMAGGQGGLYRRDYGPAHGVGLADALIAATAALHQAKLVSLNARHFPMVEVEGAYAKGTNMK